MKYNRLKISFKQSQLLMYYETNKNLSIDQIAWARSCSPILLSTLVNSAKGKVFLEGVRQLPPSILENYIMVANLIPGLLPLFPEQLKLLKKSK